MLGFSGTSTYLRQLVLFFILPLLKQQDDSILLFVIFIKQIKHKLQDSKYLLHSQLLGWQILAMGNSQYNPTDQQLLRTLQRNYPPPSQTHRLPPLNINNHQPHQQQNPSHQVFQDTHQDFTIDKPLLQSYKTKYLKHIRSYFPQLYLQLPKSPIIWTVCDVKQWLQVIDSVNIEYYSVEQLSIDGSVLILLEQNDLIQEIGIRSNLGLSVMMVWVEHGLTYYQDFLREQKQLNNPYPEENGQRLDNKSRMMAMRQYINKRQFAYISSKIKNANRFNSERSNNRPQQQTQSSFYNQSQSNSREQSQNGKYIIHHTLMGMSQFQYLKSPNNANNITNPKSLPHPSSHSVDWPHVHNNRYTEHNIVVSNKNSRQYIRKLQIFDKQTSVCLQVKQFPFYLITEMDQMYRDNQHFNSVGLSNAKYSQSFNNPMAQIRQYEHLQNGLYNYGQQQHSRYLQKKSRNNRMKKISLRQSLKQPITDGSYQKRDNKQTIKQRYMNMQQLYQNYDYDRCCFLEQDSTTIHSQFYKNTISYSKYLQDVGNVEIVISKNKNQNQCQTQSHHKGRQQIPNQDGGDGLQQQYFISLILKHNKLNSNFNSTTNKSKYMANTQQQEQEYECLYNKINTVKRYSYDQEEQEEHKQQDGAEHERRNGDRNDNSKDKRKMNTIGRLNRHGDRSMHDINVYILMREPTPLPQNSYNTVLQYQYGYKQQQEHSGSHNKTDKNTKTNTNTNANNKNQNIDGNHIGSINNSRNRYYNNVFKFSINQYEFIPEFHTYAYISEPKTQACRHHTTVVLYARSPYSKTSTRLHLNPPSADPFHPSPTTNILLNKLAGYPPSQLLEHLPCAIPSMYTTYYVCIDPFNKQPIVKQPQSWQSISEWKKECRHQIMASIVYLYEDGLYYLCRSVESQGRGWNAEVEGFVMGKIKGKIKIHGDVMEEKNKLSRSKGDGLDQYQDRSNHYPSKQYPNVNSMGRYKSNREQYNNSTHRNQHPSSSSISPSIGTNRVWLKFPVSQRTSPHRQKYPHILNRYDNSMRIRNGACIRVGSKQLVFNVNLTRIEYVDDSSHKTGSNSRHKGSIRHNQEKGINSHMNPFKPDSSNNFPQQNQYSCHNKCIICYQKPNNCIYLQCRHNVTCLGCGKMLEQCPICRRPIVDYMRLYTS